MRTERWEKFLSAQAGSESLNILLSYAYVARKRICDIRNEAFRSVSVHVFLDSGAFTAARTGESISVAQYIQYIHDNRADINTYAGLDVIGDCERTANNFRIMRSEGLDPIPCFHVGSDWRFLHQYLAQTDYVALGGMVPYANRKDWPRLVPWLRRAFSIAAEYHPNTPVFHAFGITNTSLARYFVWRSMDSSTATVGQRFGKVLIFDPIRFTMVQVSYNDKARVASNAMRLRALGVDPADLLRHSAYDKATAWMLAGACYKGLQDAVRSLHRTKFRLFMAHSSPRSHDMQMFAKGFLVNDAPALSA